MLYKILTGPEKWKRESSQAYLLVGESCHVIYTQTWSVYNMLTEPPCLCGTVSTFSYSPKGWWFKPTQGHHLLVGLPWRLRWWRTCLQCRRPGFNPWVRKIPWRRKCLPTPVLLPGESHGQRSLVSYSPWGCKESEKTEQLTLSYNMLDSFHCLGGKIKPKRRIMHAGGSWDFTQGGQEKSRWGRCYAREDLKDVKESFMVRPGERTLVESKGNTGILKQPYLSLILCKKCFNKWNTRCGQNKVRRNPGGRKLGAKGTQCV